MLEKDAHPITFFPWFVVVVVASKLLFLQLVEER